MSNIRFSPAMGQVADYVLNHPTASPFKANNISFHIGGTYLSDFSDKGIKKFVEKHNDDLNYKEVGAFIQSVAANAPQMAGATFNLADKELGLYEKDEVKASHIKTGFTLETQSGNLPAQGVVFFDASKATFPLLDAEKLIKTSEQNLKAAEKGLDKAQDKLEDAQYLRQRLVDFLGKNSPKDLAEKQSLVSSLEATVKDLKLEKTEYGQELSKLEEEHNNQTPNPPSGLTQEARWQRMTQLKRAIRGLDMEIKESEKTVASAKKEISEKQGPLSFMGIGNSLSELHERNQNLTKAQEGLQSARQNVDQAKQQLDAAKALRERILRGEGIGGTQPAQPKPPEPAPVQPKPPEPAPVAQEPTPAPVQPTPPAPAQPKPPVVDEPIAKPPVDEDILPPAPTQPAPVQPAQPAPAQPQPVQPQPAQPAPVAQEPAPAQPQPAPAQPPATPSQPTAVYEESFIPGNRHNPLVSDDYGVSGPAPKPPAPAPVQPAPTPAQPAPVQQQPAPVQPAPAPAQPVQPAQPTPAPAQPAPVQGVTPIDSVSKILYTVKKGDTLSSIARTELGNWKRWPEIAQMNRPVIGSTNTHWIYPGQVLTLPPLQLKPRPTH
jgi:LysM repeat protein